MPSAETESIPSDIPSGFIRLNDVYDRTTGILNRERAGGLYARIFTQTPEQVYRQVLNRAPEENSITESIALRPQEVGTRDSTPNSLWGPGLIASHPDATPGLPRLDSRSALLPNGTLIKGVGARTVALANQSNDPKLGFLSGGKHSGWEIVGGVDREKAELEFLNSVYLAYMYQQLYPGETIPVRVASHVVDISESLERQSSNSTQISPAHQVFFENVNQPIRNIYAKYLSSPDLLFSNTDFSSDEGKRQCLNLWNNLQSAWLLEYAAEHPDENNAVHPISFEEFIATTDLSGKNMFELMQDQKDLLSGSKNFSPIKELIDSVTQRIHASIPILSGYTQNELLHLRGAQFQIKHVSGLIAHKFMEKNEGLVIKTLTWNIERIGKMLGMSYAVGWDLGSAASSKDMYGSKVADLDVVVQFPDDPFKEITYGGYQDTFFHVRESIADMARMYGLTQRSDPKILEDLENMFRSSLTQGYSRTLEDLSKLGLSQTYIDILRAYHLKLISHQTTLTVWQQNSNVKQQLAISASSFYSGLDLQEYDKFLNRTKNSVFPRIFARNDNMAQEEQGE